jgi:hypothetical protein
MWYSNLEKKTFISRHVLHQHYYTCPIALPVLRNPQHRSLLTVVSATSAPPFQPLRHQRNVCHPVVNRFTRQTLPTINMKHFLMNILCIESFCPQKRTTVHCSSVVNSSNTVAILTTETSLWHALALLLPRKSRCCCLVIHKENVLHQVQLFYGLFTDSLVQEHSQMQLIKYISFCLVICNEFCRNVFWGYECDLPALVAAFVVSVISICFVKQGRKLYWRMGLHVIVIA